MRVITLALSISLLASNVMAEHLSVKEQMIKSISTRDDTPLLTCLNISKKEGDSIKNEIIKSCYEPLPDDDALLTTSGQATAENMNNCSKTVLQKKGVYEKLKACSQAHKSN